MNRQLVTELADREMSNALITAPANRSAATALAVAAASPFVLLPFPDGIPGQHGSRCGVGQSAVEGSPR